MSRDLSVTLKQAVHKPETSEVALCLLDIEYQDGGEQHIRVVNDAVDIVSNGETFTAYPFDIELPAEESDRPPQATLRIDNVDRMLVAAIRSITTPPTVSVSVVLASDPDVIEVGPVELTLRSLDYDAHTISGRLTFESALEEAFPGHRKSPANFPGIFGALPPGTVWTSGDREADRLRNVGKLYEPTTTVHGRRGRT